jgi:hypothetical protein
MLVSARDAAGHAITIGLSNAMQANRRQLDREVTMSRTSLSLARRDHRVEALRRQETIVDWPRLSIRSAAETFCLICRDNRQ